MEKKVRIYLLLIIYLFLLTNCFNVSAQENEKTYLVFIQGDRSYRINHYADSIVLEKKAFSIHFYFKKNNPEENEIYWADISTYSNYYSASSGVGSEIERMLNFRSGSTLATDQNGKYQYLYINAVQGCQSLYYKNEGERTMDLIAEDKGILEFKWEIFQIYENQKTFPISKIKYPYLSFIILIDRNLNGVVDEGEYKSIKVLFE